MPYLLNLEAVRVNDDSNVLQVAHVAAVTVHVQRPVWRVVGVPEHVQQHVDGTAAPLHGGHAAGKRHEENGSEERLAVDVKGVRVRVRVERDAAYSHHTRCPKTKLCARMLSRPSSESAALHMADIAGCQ